MSWQYIVDVVGAWAVCVLLIDLSGVEVSSTNLLTSSGVALYGFGERPRIYILTRKDTDRGLTFEQGSKHLRRYDQEFCRRVHHSVSAPVQGFCCSECEASEISLTPVVCSAGVNWCFVALQVGDRINASGVEGLVEQVRAAPAAAPPAHPRPPRPPWTRLRRRLRSRLPFAGRLRRRRVAAAAVRVGGGGGADPPVPHVPAGVEQRVHLRAQQQPAQRR